MTKVSNFIPAYNFFYIEFYTSEYSSSYKVELRDPSGILKYVYFTKNPSSTTRYYVDIQTNLNPGVYFVDIYHKTGTNYLIAGQWFGQFVKH
jgi:hypothetical protein